MPDSLAAHGLDVAGLIPAEVYDPLVPAAWRSSVSHPGARSAVVIASRGPAFYRAFAPSPEACDGRIEPLDRFTQRVVEAAAASWDSPVTSLFYWQRRSGHHADFVELGRQAGLGTHGRLGLLLHPEAGPWLAIRALWLTAREIAAPRAPVLAPGAFCAGCAAPCTDACPGHAVSEAGFDALACLDTRRRLPGCRDRCDARHACVLGQAERYDPEAEAFFGRAALRDPDAVE